MTSACTHCARPIDGTAVRPAPEKWTEKHPPLAGMCLDCAMDWVHGQDVKWP